MRRPGPVPVAPTLAPVRAIAATPSVQGGRAGDCPLPVRRSAVCDTGSLELVMRYLLLPAALLLAAPAAAESFSSAVLDFDPQTSVLVLRDKSVLRVGDAVVPADLGAGDAITVVYDGGGYDGMVRIHRIERTAD